MGLTLSQRRAVTKAIATRYQRADKRSRGVILDELCATAGWHRNHARQALAAVLKPKIVKPAMWARTPKYDTNTIVALRFCWAVLGAPTGKRLAPMLGELVAMSAATMDRRLAEDRAKLTLRARSHTKKSTGRRWRR